MHISNERLDRMISACRNIPNILKRLFIRVIFKRATYFPKKRYSRRDARIITLANIRCAGLYGSELFDDFPNDGETRCGQLAFVQYYYYYYYYRHNGTSPVFPREINANGAITARRETIIKYGNFTNRRVYY